MAFGSISKMIPLTTSVSQSLTSTTDVEHHLRTIFRRCVQCPPGTPSCPQCSAGQTCSLKAESCTECASTMCIDIGSLPGQTPNPPKPIGAIVGGVLGGIAFIVILIYLLWRFRIKPQRKQEDQQLWTDQAVEKRDQSGLNRSARQSTRSQHSIASTVLTRASNVIQIAYIPGVTNRSPPDSPNLLVPPVPALPVSATTSAASTPYLEQDRHFFMPGDLRDSSYSDFSEMDRNSIAPSLARASVATNAFVPPLPAQQAHRGRPAMVSVHTPASQNSTVALSPLNPRIPKGLANSNSPFVGRTVTPKPIEVKKARSGPRVPTLASLKVAAAKLESTKNPSSSSSPPAELDAGSKGQSNHDSQAVTIIEDSPILPAIKPKASFASFKSTSSSAPSSMLPANTGLPPDVTKEIEQDGPQHRKSVAAGLTTMIEEAMNRAARDVVRSPDSPILGKNDSSPFSDANEVKENL
jgi:protein OPY2